MSKKLTPKQQIFVTEYLKDLNATQAAIRAGYSPRTAAEMGYENLRKPHIRDKIEKVLSEGELTKERILREESILINSTIKDLFDKDGTPINPSD